MGSFAEPAVTGGRIIGISTLQDTFFRPPRRAERKKRHSSPRADALG
jgi:hypothetical protein